MGIHKFKQFEVEAEVCGQVRTVSWEATEGIMAITGIHSFAEAVEILHELALGGVVSMGMEETPTKTAADDRAAPPVPTEEFAAAENALQHQARSGMVPAAVPVTKPLDGKPLPKFEDKLASESPRMAAVTSDDMAVFGRMVKIGEVVEELRKRGHHTYEAILAECRKMAGVGDVCPPVDQLHAAGTLEDRLKVHLAGKGIAVPA
jgi:hypothetical protein